MWRSAGRVAGGGEGGTVAVYVPDRERSARESLQGKEGVLRPLSLLIPASCADGRAGVSTRGRW